MKTVLVTGSAGFIGYHVATILLKQGFRVIGLDAMNDYYDVSLKKARHQQLSHPRFIPVIERIESPGIVLSTFRKYVPDYVVHLAAQAGVRYSMENPRSYLESNIIGTFEILEAARSYPPKHMLLASTSSAYGANTEMPYQETQRADHQMSFYAATKKAAENMAHSYAHLFNLPITMFRFFTVYGPWGRPDMAYFKFTRAIAEGRPIDVYNNGDMKRDFTYVEDLAKALWSLLDTVPNRPGQGQMILGDSLSPVAPHRVVNIGNNNTTQLMDFITAIEDALGVKAMYNMMPMQAGDVPGTWADVRLLKALTGDHPKTDIRDGVAKFVDWYKDYYE